MKKLLFLSLGLSLLLVNCTEDDLPINPYDNVDYTDNTIVVDTLSETSFVRLHKEVLAPSCNVLGCHDGTFEPDFRTVESSYNTMVYHPIIKNNLAETFTYRVVPNDTLNSVLHERLTNCCFVNTDDRMPQDNIGNSLSQEDLDVVSNWIMSGAKDITGATPNEPNNLPNIDFFFVMDVAFDSTYSDNRIGEWYEPFLMPSNEDVNFIFRVWDDKTAPADMQVNKLHISEFQDDFSNSFIATATFYDPTYDVWVVPFNTAVLQTGKTYYLRYEINDGQTANTIYPNNQTSFIFKSMWSFTVQ